MKKIICLILSLLLISSVFVSCGSSSDDENSTAADVDYELTNPDNPVATIEMKDGGKGNV